MILLKKNQNSYKKNLLFQKLIIQKYKYYMKVVNQKFKVRIMNYRVDKANKAITICYYNKVYLRMLKQNNQLCNSKLSLHFKRKSAGSIY